jgi:hypothetical protein
MDMPYLDVALGSEKSPRGDHYYLALLRQVLGETRATIAQSRASIDWSHDAIMLLDRLSAKQRTWTSNPTFRADPLP